MATGNVSCDGEIKVEVQGGMGNQLFQISNGLNLSFVNKIPVSFFFRKTRRRSFIENFCAIQPDNSYYFEGYNLRKTAKANHKYCKWNNFQEKNFYYEPIKNVHNHMQVKGYFQSFKYFAEIEEYIRENIFKTFNLVPENPKMHDIAIHFRLGDYVRIKKNRKIYMLPDDEYIFRALKRIRKITKNEQASINIFTDDRKMMEKLYGTSLEKIPHYIFDGNGSQSFTAFANHYNKIISNSTFSWWAAWATQGNVVSPQDWFFPSSNIKLIREDIFPKSWNLVPMRIKI